MNKDNKQNYRKNYHADVILYLYFSKFDISVNMVLFMTHRQPTLVNSLASPYSPYDIVGSEIKFVNNPVNPEDNLKMWLIK